MAALRTVLVSAGLVLLAGCQAQEPASDAASSQDCSPGLGSHLCNSGPVDPNLGLDPSLQSQGGHGGGSH